MIRTLFISLCFLFPTFLFAYIPPSFFLVHSLANKHANLSNGVFRSQIFLLNSDGQKTDLLEERLVLDGGVATVSITKNGGLLKKISRKLVENPEADKDRPPLWDLLFIKDKNSIFEHFKELGFPLKTALELYSEKEGDLPYKQEEFIKLKLSNLKPVIEMKGKGNVVWFDQESPAAAETERNPKLELMPLYAKIGSYEYRFSGGKFIYGSYFPTKIEVLKNEKPWIRIETKEGVVVDIPDTGLSAEASNWDSFFESYTEAVR